VSENHAEDAAGALTASTAKNRLSDAIGCHDIEARLDERQG